MVNWVKWVRRCRVPGRRHMVLRISIRLNATGGPYRATVTTPTGSYDVEAPKAFSAMIREDMRNLRGKAIGLRDPGDSVLIGYGTKILCLLFSEDRRAVLNWLQQ